VSQRSSKAIAPQLPPYTNHWVVVYFLIGFLAISLKSWSILCPWELWLGAGSFTSLQMTILWAGLGDLLTSAVFVEAYYTSYAVSHN